MRSLPSSRAVPSLKSRAALTTAYAAGLRTSEVVGLRIEDIDSARGVIAVRSVSRSRLLPNASRAHLLLRTSCPALSGRPHTWPIANQIIGKSKLLSDDLNHVDLNPVTQGPQAAARQPRPRASKRPPTHGSCAWRAGPVPAALRPPHPANANRAR